MSIYTKTGDDGTTSLFGGKRLSKGDIQVRAYGAIDELSSFLGLLISKTKEKSFLIAIQKDLYIFMAVLSGYPPPQFETKDKVLHFEKEIDRMDQELPKLHEFILPGGDEISSLFHVVRATTRRAEREVVSLYCEQKNLHQKEIMIYLNRLSDFFFTCARYYSSEQELLAKNKKK